MITESDIKIEIQALNDAAAKYGKTYTYQMGKNNYIGLFDIQGDTYRPVYCASTTAGFFAYVSLLKNIYRRNKKKDGD